MSESYTNTAKAAMDLTTFKPVRVSRNSINCRTLPIFCTIFGCNRHVELPGNHFPERHDIQRGHAKVSEGGIQILRHVQ